MANEDAQALFEQYVAVLRSDYSGVACNMSKIEKEAVIARVEGPQRRDLERAGIYLPDRFHRELLLCVSVYKADHQTEAVFPYTAHRTAAQLINAAIARVDD